MKAAVNALCRRDANLISAQAALQFCIIQLQKQNSCRDQPRHNRAVTTVPENCVVIARIV